MLLCPLLSHTNGPGSSCISSFPSGRCREVRRLGHDRFLPYPLQFFIDQASYRRCCIVWNTDDLEYIPSRGKNFCKTGLDDHPWCTPCHIFSDYRWIFPQAKAARACTLSPSAEVKNEWSSTPNPPYACLARCYLNTCTTVLQRKHSPCDPDVDGRIILGWIFRKWEGVVGTGWSWLRIGRDGGHLWVH